MCFEVIVGDFVMGESQMYLACNVSYLQGSFVMLWYRVFGICSRSFWGSGNLVYILIA